MRLAFWRRRSRIYDLGHFEGPVFVFNEPFTMPSGQVVRRMDMTYLEKPDDVSLENIVEVMTDPRAVVGKVDPDDPDSNLYYTDF